MTRTCSFTVAGLPVAQPRPRVTRFGTHVPKEHAIHGYRNSIAAAFLNLNEVYRQPFNDAVCVSITFWFPRTQAMIWKTRPMLPAPKMTKPDIDNLCKSVLDALEDAGAYQHDSQVCELTAQKWFVQGHAEPRTGICISDSGGLTG
jgi:Holliday junction resolvase RusA-like endonuclease